MAEDNHQHDQLAKEVRLSIQRALLGEVTPNLRGVTIGWGRNWISAVFVYDGEVTEKETDTVSVVETEVIADFPAEFVIEFSARQSSIYQALNDFTLMYWVYRRMEYPLVPALTDIHDYWFGELAGPDEMAEGKADLWFRQSDATDDDIRRRFGKLLALAAAHEWNVHALNPTERVGLVVLFDQFPRNLFRKTGEAFAYDALARKLTTEILREGDEEFHPLERVFLYLPFEHSENLADQDHAVALYQRLLDERGNKNPFFKLALEFAEKHRDLIRRFGRFPHRNAMLGRESTPEELAFLKEHGRGY